jgi:chorismate mutase
MTSWKEERDRLVTQTLAFVQRVAAANPGASRLHKSVQHLREPIAVSATPEVTAMPTTPATVDSPPPVEVSPEIGTLGSGAPPPRLLAAAMLANQALYSTASERAEIIQRVAAFKARQSQIGREREAYYETMQARIRSVLGNDSSNGRL